MIGRRVDSEVADAPEATYGFSDRDSPHAGQLGLTPVTAHGWRVVDDRLPARDPFRLLAFIERRGDLFEVMQLGAGFEWHEFESLDAAVAFVCETGSRLAQERMRGDLAWIA